MADVLRIGLGNAAAATALALAAAVICRLLRGGKPAVVHALWLLVLLKLLTPPLWTANVPRSWPRGKPAAAEISRADEPPQLQFDAVAGPSEYLEPSDDGQNAAGVVSQWLPAPAAAQPAAVATLPALPRLTLAQWTIGLWAAGSMICLAVVIKRTFQFRRLLSHAVPAPPEVVERTRRLAARLGVKRLPSVLLVPGAVCPMLWAVLGRPRLLLPAGLWAGLPEAQRDTLIAHELAHLRRRDHWVRLIEVAATVLYWWHPVAWWARRELRGAEEQCCDAWVVWSMPRCARQYMSAILNAVDYVSEAAAPLRPPPLACGMASGEFRQLQRRLVMIRSNEATGIVPARRTLGRGGLLALCAGALALLPLAPSLAQQESPRRKVTVEAAPVAENAGGDLELEGALTLVRPEPELSLRPVPVTTEVHLTSPDPFLVVDVKPGGTTQTFDAAEIRFMPSAAEPEHARFSLERARHDVERLSVELEAAKARLATAEAVAGRSAKSYKTVTVGKKHGAAGSGPLKLGVKARAVRRQAESKPDDSGSRLDELERKLDRLLNEVESLKESRRGRSTTPPVMLQTR